MGKVDGDKFIWNLFLWKQKLGPANLFLFLCETVRANGHTRGHLGDGCRMGQYTYLHRTRGSLKYSTTSDYI